MNQQPPQHPNSNLYPESQERILGIPDSQPTQPPSPPPPTNTPAPTPTPAPEKKKNHTVLFIVLGCLGVFIIVIGILAAMIWVSLNGAKDKAKDAQIRSILSSEGAYAQIYFDEHQTYKNLTLNASDLQTIQTAGSKAIIQGLSDKTFVIYANLPSSQKFFCLDASGFMNEISVAPTGSKCQ